MRRRSEQAKHAQAQNMPDGAATGSRERRLDQEEEIVVLQNHLLPLVQPFLTHVPEQETFIFPAVYTGLPSNLCCTGVPSLSPDLPSMGCRPVGCYGAWDLHDGRMLIKAWCRGYVVLESSRVYFGAVVRATSRGKKKQRCIKKSHKNKAGRSAIKKSKAMPCDSGQSQWLRSCQAASSGLKNRRNHRQANMGRAKLENVMLSSKSSRKECFNKRCRGAFKKIYELARICGAGVRMIIEGEDGNIYQFHRRLNPALHPKAVENDLDDTALATSGALAMIDTPSHNIDPDMARPRTLPPPSTRSFSSKQSTNRYMFYNGGRTMLDSGMPVTRDLRQRLLDPDNCNCFDCNNGYSNGLFETISVDHALPPLYGDDRPFFQKAPFMGNALSDMYMNPDIQHDNVAITSETEGTGPTGISEDHDFKGIDRYNDIPPTYQDPADCTNIHRSNSAILPTYQETDFNNIQSHNAMPSTYHFHDYQDQNAMSSTYQGHDFKNMDDNHNAVLSTHQLHGHNAAMSLTYENHDVKDISQNGMHPVFIHETSAQQVGQYGALTLPALPYQASDQFTTTALTSQENNLVMGNCEPPSVVDFPDRNIDDPNNNIYALLDDPVDGMFALLDCYCGRENCEDMEGCFTKALGCNRISEPQLSNIQPTDAGNDLKVDPSSLPTPSNMIF
ncbi:hypothetical protein GOP47_0028247 [Adiantum capillus-veneris]|nr:hypothetical protein GOP47_0028247 [Adiantum capillus-veneris]